MPNGNGFHLQNKYDPAATRRLVLALLVRALRDARNTTRSGQDARGWLLSYGQYLAGTCGVSLTVDDFQKWIDTGAIIPDRRGWHAEREPATNHPKTKI